MKVKITKKDRKKFKSEGYMIIKNVVPSLLIQPACIEIAESIQANLSDKTTWYYGDSQNDGIVPVHHLQSIWDIRQDKQVYAAFSEFWNGETELYVDINRVCFRPPCCDQHPLISRGEIHWDIDPRLGSEGWIQGIVLLTDIQKDTGGFQCIPEIYKTIKEWLKENAQQRDFDHFNPGLNSYPALQLEGKAGDIILWSTLLPHGPAINLSNQPRIAAFITLAPNKKFSQQSEYRSLIKQKRAPKGWRNLPGQKDPETGKKIILTTLGKRITGLLPWK